MAKKQKMQRASKEIARIVEQDYNGDVRAAATDLDVSYNQLWRVVRGHSENGPSLAMIVLIANKKGISIDELVYGEA